MTTIRYFIPEDGDIESQPNVFLSPKSRSAGAPPTLGQIMNAFPVPGQYHFRFKTALVPGTDREKGAMAVWMDVTDERQPVPTWQGGIVVKVTRITMEDDDDDDDDDDHHFSNKTQQPSPHAHHHHHQQQQQQQKPPPARAPPSHSHSSSMGSANSGDHIDLFNSPQPTANAVPPAPSSGGSLLDFDTGGHHTTPAAQTSNAHADFLGMTAPTASAAAAAAPPSSSLPPMGGGGGYPPANNMYAQQQQQQQQQYQQQQNSGGAFGGLGTPW
eukprot:CAMPEP_0113501490 /NCGR_PEP_ID=MMETSP0014_2-20120614/32984_1 /TAXON_ID=2857 /ORGANISM="Nitzschia sp." /LENGTH=270 /DNA_ID=CAMNT_0000396085 /DNA_START=57 /DNA_END=866 /DNA_ORIENTATION=+ /assembly_acc=CAM_ASM_000159